MNKRKPSLLASPGRAVILAALIFGLALIGANAARVSAANAPIAPGAGANELLVFDWNKPVTERNRGFPWDNPPMASANGDWTRPINFAEGTLYLRAEIKDIPSAKLAKLQFCFWQFKNKRENCTQLRALQATPDQSVVVTWSVPVQKMWKKGGVPIDWTQPRMRNGVAIKNSSGKPVSSYAGWNWNGEDPTQWYPMDLRFTVVVVAKGGVFSGWENYIR